MDGTAVIAGGRCLQPARPGFGVELNQAVIDAHRLAAIAPNAGTVRGEHERRER